MERGRTIVVPAESAGERLDSFLRRVIPELGRSARLSLIDAGRVRLNGHRARKGAALAAGDRVEIEDFAVGGPLPDPALALRILHEDADLVAVDKPAGIPSHALRPGESGTIASALLARYPSMAGTGYRELEAGLLHRLDTETSGILLAARSAHAFQKLRAAHERGEFRKQYLALVRGQPALGIHTAYIRADRRKVKVELEPFDTAKRIRCEIVSAEAHAAFTLVRVELALAARHQVRAQLARLGHPIAGDALYGGPALPGLTRHFLHASCVSLPHPSEGRTLVLEAPLPEDLREVLRAISAISAISQ
jgi:23S rRNA pseudouridine1911/1915/1917 synthase